MLDNIVSRVHLLLLEQIDGPAAERFLRHIEIATGDITTLGQRYTEAELLTWLSGYWIQQISAQCLMKSSTQEYNLLACHTPDDFIQVFISTVIPCLKIHTDVPNMTLPIIPLHHDNARPKMETPHG